MSTAKDIFGLVILALLAGCSGEKDFSGGSKAKKSPPPRSAGQVEKNCTGPDCPSVGTSETGNPDGTSTTVPDPKTGAPVEAKTLTVTLGAAAAKVVITVNGAASECNATCSKSFPKGSAVTVSTTSKAAAAPLTRALKAWDGGCTVNGKADGECTLTLNSDVTIQPVYKDVSSYGAGMSGSIANVLRNSVYLQVNKVITAPGLPPGTCSAQTCDTVFIFNDEGARARVCSVVHPGSTVSSFTTGVPSAAGWSPYYNLFIAQLTTSGWQRICNGGADCNNKQQTYIATLACESETR